MFMCYHCKNLETCEDRERYDNVLNKISSLGDIVPIDADISVRCPHFEWPLNREDSDEL